MTEAVVTRLMFVAAGVNFFLMLFPFRRFGVSQQWLRVIKGAGAAFLLAMALRLLVFTL